MKKSFFISQLRNPVTWLGFIALAGCQTASMTGLSDLTSSYAGKSNSAPIHSAIMIAPPVDRIVPTIISESIESGEQAVVYDNLWDRITSGFDLQGHYSHPAVLKQVERYENSQRLFDQVSQRAGPYLYWIVEELEKRGLPLELALIPVVESVYNPSAYSHQHAAGMWQFVAATGRIYGLEQNWWYDGRRDPVASTLAAINYLESLYTRFDQDWLLAFAAYNTGEGNLIRAIRRNERASLPTDFWHLPLAAETRNHVPRILAIAKIVADTEKYGIDLTPLANDPYFEMVTVDSQIDLSLAARLADVELEQLKHLNSGYLQWATHPDQQQTLLIPIDNVAMFIEKLATLPAQDRVTWDRYEIQSGDNLSLIASKLGTRVDILITVNNLQSDQIIAGRSLLVPRTSDPSQLRIPEGLVYAKAAGVPESYRVRIGDSLWTIARKFDLKSRDIARWNQLSMNAVIQPGQTLSLKPITSLES